MCPAAPVLSLPSVSHRSAVVSQNKPLAPSTSLFVSELFYSVEVGLEVLLFKYLEENIGAKRCSSQELNCCVIFSLRREQQVKIDWGFVYWGLVCAGVVKRSCEVKLPALVVRKILLHSQG